MAMMKVVLESDFDTRVVPIGFSWTNLFFGYFLPFSRNDQRGFGIQFVLLFLTLGMSQFIFPFFYNKMQIKYLLSKGYSVSRVHGGTLEMAQAALGISIKYKNRKNENI